MVSSLYGYLIESSLQKNPRSNDLCCIVSIANGSPTSKEKQWEKTEVSKGCPDPILHLWEVLEDKTKLWVRHILGFPLLHVRVRELVPEVTLSLVEVVYCFVFVLLWFWGWRGKWNWSNTAQRHAMIRGRSCQSVKPRGLGRLQLAPSCYKKVGGF